MLKAGCVLHPFSKHVLFLTLTIPSFLCIKQNRGIFSPSILKVGLILQPSSIHVLLTTFTIPSFLCATQYKAFFSPAVLKDGRVLQPRMQDVGMILFIICKIFLIQFYFYLTNKNKKYFKIRIEMLASRSFDLRTLGLWAPCASSAPRCFFMRTTICFFL